ncbi:hypothetical protein AEAC466_06570 [Asticcacaulis sp. AC466]|nr:hypothetical protein AEAC466_06570 [Asticcacaulis sp. AC466]
MSREIDPPIVSDLYRIVMKWSRNDLNLALSAPGSAAIIYLSAKGDVLWVPP